MSSLASLASITHFLWCGLDLPASRSSSCIQRLSRIWKDRTVTGKTCSLQVFLCLNLLLDVSPIFSLLVSTLCLPQATI
ncbi:hypothetical protein BDZ97DRAFT_1847422 [Flammula alnicola]|nr:hypothetical protein BDZ97DRAFT_1847422 [Flammula alnicola]